MPLAPVIGLDGEWGTAQGLAVREALSRGSLDSVMDVIDALGADSPAIAGVLQEAGFVMPDAAVDVGRDAVLAAVQKDLIEAVTRRIDGFELRAGRPEPVLAVPETGMVVPEGFFGDREAVEAIQRVLSSPVVEVDLLGDVVPAQRMSLQCVAAQAMEAGVQGFRFDGLPGKFMVPCNLHEIMDLHEAAAVGIAVESVREGIDTWRQGGRVSELPRWVPDSAQRLLQGSLSEESARILARAVDEGGVARYAGEAGRHVITQALAAQGLDVNAPTVEQQAETLGLAMSLPNAQRDKFVGSVVGTDHRAALIKVARGTAIAVPFSDFPDGRASLSLGDMARIDVRKGVMTVSVVDNDVGRGVGR